MYSHSRALVQCRRFRVFGIWFISLFLVGSMPLAAYADNEKVMAVMSRQAGDVARLAERLAKMEAFSKGQMQDMAALRERHAREVGDLDAEVVRLEEVESTLREEIEALKTALLEAQLGQRRIAEEKEELTTAAAEKQKAAVARAQEEAREEVQQEVKRRLEEQRIQSEKRHSKELADLRRSMEAERGAHAAALQKTKAQMEAELARRGGAYIPLKRGNRCGACGKRCA